MKNRLKRSLTILLVICLLQACKKDNEQPALNISSFSPQKGSVDEEVILTGNNFSTNPDANTVDFNGTATTVKAATSTSLIVHVPAGATTGKITVTTNGRKAISEDDFTLLLTTTVKSFIPTTGMAGTEVIITGTNFDLILANNSVQFNGKPAFVTEAQVTQLKVTVPAGVTTGKVTVSVNGLMVTSTDDFTVTAPTLPAPTISTISMERAVVGTDLILTGTNFNTLVESDNSVTFNGIPATVKSVDSDGKSLIVTVPFSNNASGVILLTVNGVPATYNHPILFAVRVQGGAAVRVKEVVRNYYKVMEYVYDNNVLIQAKIFSRDSSDPNAQPYQVGINNYIYDGNGNLITIEEANLIGPPHHFSDYTYANGVCESFTYSEVINSVKTAQYTHTYTWQNGLIVKDVYSDPNGGSGQITYDNSTNADGNPQTTAHYPTFDNIYIYYPGDIVSPDPLDDLPNADKRIVKKMMSGLNSKYDQQSTYTFTGDGNNVQNVNYYYSHSPNLDYKIGYNFEIVQ